MTRQDIFSLVRSIMSTSIQIPYEWVKCFIYWSTLIPFKKLSLRRSSSDWFSGVTPMPRFHSRAISSPCRNPVSPKYASLLSSQNIELTSKVYAEQAQVEKSRDALIYNCAQRMWLIVVPVFIYKLRAGVHQNTLENIPIIWAVSVSSPLYFRMPFFLHFCCTRTIFVGIQKPILATSLCSLWVLGRISYTFGYITGDPIKVRETVILFCRQGTQPNLKRVTVLYGAGTLGMLGMYFNPCFLQV